MHVESVDVLKEYAHGSRSLRVLVRIVDEDNSYVANCVVRLAFCYEGTLRIHREAITDHNGIAEFYLYGVRGGNWSLEIIEVEHPFYKTPMSAFDTRAITL